MPLVTTASVPGAPERVALLRSIAVTAVLGGLGIAWGLATGSQMILLDGVYAVVGIVVSWLLLLASRLARRGPTRHYPFGREAATPLVIGVQGFVLLATLGYAAIGATRAILDGGSEVVAGWASVYGVIVTVASLWFWIWIHRAAGHSDLLAAEATAWKVAAWRGVGMVVGFGAMVALLAADRDDVAAYVDPVMVLVTCVVFVGPPVAMVRGTLVELLQGAPGPDLQQVVRDAAERLAADYGLTGLDLLMTKVGPKLYVELEAVAPPDLTIATQYEYRERLRAALDAVPYEVWLNVELLPEPSPGA